MVKKLLTLIMGLGLAFSAAAQIDHDDILYWVGSGDAHAIVAISWDAEEVGFAWGVAYDSEMGLSTQDALDSIKQYDPRFNYQFSIYGGWTIMGFSSLTFNFDGEEIGIANTETPCVYMEGNLLSDPSEEWEYEYVEEEDGIILISTGCYQDYSSIVPVDPPTESGEESTIAASDILYWIGEGDAEAIFVIDWGTGTRAWGFHFDANAAPTIGTMMQTIADADPRLIAQSYGIFFCEYPIYTEMYSFSIRANGTAASSSTALTDGMLVKAGNVAGSVWSNPITPATISLMQEDATIAASDVTYWLGSGSNSAVIAVNWGDPDTALAWGIHFNGMLTLTEAIDTMLLDSRVGVDNHSAINSITFNDSNINLSFHTGSYLQFRIDGNGNASFSSRIIDDGSFIKIGESAYGFGYDTVMYSGYGYPSGVVWPTEVHPVNDPNASDTTVTDTTEVPVDATIAASDILYWVGEGSNEVVLAINWADTALAWGYRFSTDSVLVGTIVSDIATADPRFSIEGDASYISDFLFSDSTTADTLRVTPHAPTDYSIYFNMQVNHISSMLGAGMHMVGNGDFVKFADTYVAVKADSTWIEDWGGYWDYNYVWPYEIQPVSVPSIEDTTVTDTTIVTPEHGPFCGGVGTEGCDAIKADSSAIVAWATGIELNRGPQNISAEGSPLASYGAADSAIGPATNNTMRAVSLGDGGTATVTFAHPIRNGEGPDFAVFENGFPNQLLGNYSLELAFVEVSSDGERFVRFPATSLTQTESQTANAGAIDPTNINNLAGKYQVGYGTPFDLAELADSTGIDIDSIVYVRIVDVVGSIDSLYATYDAFGHIINDPWPTPFASSGFDLTGVAVMYEREDVEPTAEDASIAATDIIYWVGEGSNEVVFAINWADSALAWGYRFSTDSVVVSTIISDIVEADPRLSIEGDPTFVSDFIFVDSVNNKTLRITPHDEGDYSIYFNMQVNHISSMLGAGMHMVANGDFVKFADTYVAVKADSTWIEDWGGYWDYTYVWPYAITPVSEPGHNEAIDVAANVVMSIYPNPATSVVNVVAKAGAEAILFDMAGRRVMDITLREGRNTLDLSALDCGIYMLRTAGSVEKIVKR